LKHEGYQISASVARQGLGKPEIGLQSRATSDQKNHKEENDQRV
jgi:hypothetical protein